MRVSQIQTVPLACDCSRVAAERDRLRDALEACRQYLRHHHNANGGWWNDPVVYDLIKKHIDPALGTHTE